jgi:plastocyanin
MQLRKFVVLAAGLALVACGGEKKPDAPPPNAAPTPAPAGNAAPITGKTNVVLLVGEATGSRFEPASLTIKVGDGIRFDGVSGGPHNVSIDPTTLSAEAKAAFIANMPSQDMGELSSKLIPDKESYTISFANVPPGTYVLNCTPHMALQMKMTVTVQK